MVGTWKRLGRSWRRGRRSSGALTFGKRSNIHRQTWLKNWAGELFACGNEYDLANCGNPEEEMLSTS
jgi:hypothetical protein